MWHKKDLIGWIKVTWPVVDSLYIGLFKESVTVHSMWVVQDTSRIWDKLDMTEDCTHHIMDSRMQASRLCDEQRRALHPPVALPTLGRGEGGAADGVVSAERSQIHIYFFYYQNNYKQPLVQFVQSVSTLLLIIVSAWTWLQKVKNNLTTHTNKLQFVWEGHSSFSSCEYLHFKKITIKRTVIIEVISIGWSFRWQEH